MPPYLRIDTFIRLRRLIALAGDGAYIPALKGRGFTRRPIRTRHSIDSRFAQTPERGRYMPPLGRVNRRRTPLRAYDVQSSGLHP